MSESASSNSASSWVTFLGRRFAPPSMLTIILVDMTNEGQWSVSYTQPSFAGE